MKRNLVALGLATAIVLPVIGEAQAASEVAAPPAPASTNAPCTAHPPVLLDPGALSHARLRISLAANANRSGTQFNTEHVRAKTVGPDGSIVPREPIGIGASWRVVNCDQIDSTPARETRTYTLESTAHGVVVASYRDIVQIDPARVDLGSDTTAAGVVHYRLVSLRGTATGTMRLPLANALGGLWSTRTTAQVVFDAIPAHAGRIAIHTSLVDDQTVSPTA